MTLLTFLAIVLNTAFLLFPIVYITQYVQNFISKKTQTFHFLSMKNIGTNILLFVSVLNT